MIHRVKNWNVLKMHGLILRQDILYLADVVTLSKRCFIYFVYRPDYTINISTDVASWGGAVVAGSSPGLVRQ